nr:hypothetical protein [Conexibacter sp. W3-3-2]
MRLVLAVGVEHHHDVGAAVERVEVAGLLVAAVAGVVGVPDDAQAQTRRDVDGVVGAVVVDQQDLVDPVRRDRADRVLERRRRVARGHDDRDLLALAAHRCSSR